MKEENKKKDIFKIILIIIIMVSTINTFIVLQKDISIMNNPENQISNCAGLAYYGENAERDKQKCLERLEKAKENAKAAERYLKNYEQTHVNISYILLAATIITLLLGLIKRKKLSYIGLSIITIILNIMLLL